MNLFSYSSFVPIDPLITCLLPGISFSKEQLSLTRPLPSRPLSSIRGALPSDTVISLTFKLQIQLFPLLSTASFTSPQHLIPLSIISWKFYPLRTLWHSWFWSLFSGHCFLVLFEVLFSYTCLWNVSVSQSSVLVSRAHSTPSPE